MRNILAVTFALVMFAGVACAATNATPVTPLLPSATSNNASGQLALLPSEGAPMPLCQPGHQCPPVMQPQQVASEGAPMPLCQPGHQCPPVIQPQQVASEGAPMPL